MDDPGSRGARRVVETFRRHRVATVALVVLVVALAVTLVPTSRGASTSFSLDYSDGGLFGGVSVCVPEFSHLTITWSTTDPLQGFQLFVQSPGGPTTAFDAANGSAAFDSSGGSFFLWAANLSLTSGGVAVTASWVQQASLLELALAPPTLCQGL